MALAYTYEFEAIGTLWTIETNTMLSTGDKASIREILDAFDQTYSRFRADSLVSQARSTAGAWTFPDSIAPLYDMYRALEQTTKGAVNPLVGTALEQWGYDAQYSLHPAASAGTVRVPSLADTITRIDTTLHYKQPVLLDIGAIGKGHLVDMVAAYVGKHYDQYVVEAGGDMHIMTQTPYIVGLEHPFEDGQVIGSLELNAKSICASSPNRRSWGEGLHHIIDGRTGSPARTDIVATWAIADTTMLADALSTALFFADPAMLQKEYGDFQYLVMTRDFQVTHNMA